MDGTNSISGGSGSLYLPGNTSNSTGSLSGGRAGSNQASGSSSTTGSTGYRGSTGPANSTDRAALGAGILSSVLNAGITGVAAGANGDSSISSTISSIKSGILTPTINTLNTNSAIMKAYSTISPLSSNANTSSDSLSSITKELTNARTEKNLSAETRPGNSIENLTVASTAAKSVGAGKTASPGAASLGGSTAVSNSAAIKTYSGLSYTSPGSLINLVA